MKAKDIRRGSVLMYNNAPYRVMDFHHHTPGNLRADYVLPSVDLRIADARVFWPLNTSPFFPLVGVFTPSLPVG